MGYRETSKISQTTLIQSIDKGEGGGLKLCQFNTKVESLKLAWVKRLINSTTANWKVLPKHVFKCTNLNTYFSANHKPINVTATPNSTVTFMVRMCQVNVHIYSQIITVADILNLFDCSNPYKCIG